MAQTLKFETPANVPEPPPLPQKPGKGGGWLSRVRAEISIRWMHLGFWVRRHKALAAVLGLAVVVGAGGGAYVATEGLPDFGPFGTATITDASANVRAHPSDASARRDLGNAQWASKRQGRAMRSYAKALSMDPSVADDRMIANLVSAYGTSERNEAQSLITRYKLVQAEPGLEKLVSSRNHAVRWAAARTLDKIGKGTKQSWETVLAVDLKSSECSVRQEAVERLGTIGTRRSLPALRAAGEADEKTGGWFRSRCLGDRVKDAEQKIAARK